MMPNRPLHYFSICRFLPLNGADGETRTLVGQCARQLTKLVLSLLSHIGEIEAQASAFALAWLINCRG
jgi:hypothetical protein